MKIEVDRGTIKIRGDGMDVLIANIREAHPDAAVYPFRIIGREDMPASRSLVRCELRIVGDELRFYAGEGLVAATPVDDFLRWARGE